jgi:ATP-binding cassette subfamily C (CFTR/MRP) protein 4
MLAYLLTFFQQDEDVRLGYYYATGLSFTVLAVAFLVHVDFFFCMRAGMQMRVAFIAFIYQVSLSLAILVGC